MVKPRLPEFLGQCHAPMQHSSLAPMILRVRHRLRPVTIDALFAKQVTETVKERPCVIQPVVLLLGLVRGGVA